MQEIEGILQQNKGKWECANGKQQSQGCEYT